MAKKQRQLDASTTVQVDAAKIAKIMTGQRVVIDDVEVQMEEANDDMKAEEILDLIKEEIEAITEDQEEESEDEDTEPLIEDDDDDDDFY